MLRYVKLPTSHAPTYIETIISLKIPNWQEADQLAMNKHDRGVELHVGSTKKQLQLSGQGGTIEPATSDALTTRPRSPLRVILRNSKLPTLTQYW